MFIIKTLLTWVRQQQQKKGGSHISWISLLEGSDTRADLLSGSSAWALALEQVSSGTGSALEFVSTDTGTALELMSTDTGSAWSWRSFLKWEELRVTPRSPAVSILWFLFVTFSGTGWYGVENFPVFGCFTNTVSPTCMSESLTDLRYYGVLEEVSNDSTASCQSCLRNPNKILQYYRQDHMKFYRILQYPRESYKIVQDPKRNPIKSSTIQGIAS